MSSGDTQEHILDAVQAVIVRDGVRGASMRQVAEAADVSLGLLSYHFDDKESLILAALERATSRLLEASREAADAADDATAKVEAFLRGAFTNEFLDGDYLRLRISLWAVALTDPAVAAIDKAFFEQYRDEFTSLIAAARPDLDSADVAAQAVDAIAASNGAWLNWARYHDREDVERGLELSVRLALG